MRPRGPAGGAAPQWGQHATGIDFSPHDDCPAHDVVVLDRVICCYPEVARLLANTIPVARAVYAFVVPASWGVRGRMVRVAFGAEEVFRRMRRDPFRTFVRDVAVMERMLAGSGFVLRTRAARWMWELRVYTRPTPA